MGVKFLPYASDWSTIQHFRMGGKERARTIGFTGSYGDRPPESLHIVISAVGGITMQGKIPVTFGAIALGKAWFRNYKALEILALETDPKVDDEVRPWLINQAQDACRAIGYQYLFRARKSGAPFVLENVQQDLLEGAEFPAALPEGTIDV